MQVLAFPTVVGNGVGRGHDWRAQCFEFLNDLLGKVENELQMEKPWDTTYALVENKSELLGQLTLGLAKKKHGNLMEQEYCDCPQCQKKLKSRGKRKREVETYLGKFSLFRPYFYCVDSHLGFYPLDEALGLSTWTIWELGWPANFLLRQPKRRTGDAQQAHSVSTTCMRPLMR